MVNINHTVAHSVILCIDKMLTLTTETVQSYFVIKLVFLQINFAQFTQNEDAISTS